MKNENIWNKVIYNYLVCFWRYILQMFEQKKQSEITPGERLIFPLATPFFVTNSASFDGLEKRV